MSINHNDPKVIAAFDAELIAQRLGLTSHSGLIRSAADRDYLIGMIAAAERNPTADTTLLHKTAVSLIENPHKGRAELPENAPRALRDEASNPIGIVVRAGVLRRLMQRVETRRQETNEDLL